VAGRYVALLRGINVGTAKRVAMADLRALVEGLGFGEVRTLLNSGNVVFSAAGASARAADGREMAWRIEKALETKLGVIARVIVVGAPELAAVVAANPLEKIADNPSRLLVGILGDPADRERLAEIARKDWGKERIALGTGAAARAFYMWTPNGVIQSELNGAVSRALKDGVTSRNWATIQKLKTMTE
jgi:uncharacterized protein (DUF1697 family)